MMKGQRKVESEWKWKWEEEMKGRENETIHEKIRTIRRASCMEL